MMVLVVRRICINKTPLIREGGLIDISFGLIGEYYQIDEGTKKTVIDHLMEMAQRCKKL